MLLKKQVIYLTIVSILIFLLVYTPHLANPYPIHIDEWHHISKAVKLKQGELPKGIAGAESGFHVFLMMLSSVTNLILIYKFLPALWALLASLILFFITYKLTNKNFFLSIFTMLFFVSIKSNVNITGLWFFIPLTFSIPFIYLYMYFFSEGIRTENKKYLITSLIIMLLLVPTHSISLLFAIPILLTYSLINYKKTIKRYKILSLFILIPILGIFFFSLILNISTTQAFIRLLSDLQFKHGWGVLELDNSLFELYSLWAYILAIIGISTLFLNKQLRQKYLIYILWPIAVLIYIIIFRITGISFLTPYQRNLYYFVISLPFLSAVGLHTILKYAKAKSSPKTFDYLKIIIIVLTIILIFISYFSIPQNIKLYKVIDEGNYQALKFLKTFPKSKVLATPAISTAVYPVSGHNIVADIFHQSKYRDDIETFFKEKTNCTEKNQLIKKHNVTYILSEKPTNCSWEMIYNETNNTIYKI